MGKVGGWLAGVAATVISGLAIWYFTVYVPSQASQSTQTTQSSQQQQAQTKIEGMVYSGMSPVANAKVTLRLSGSAGANGPILDFTDDHGSYMFLLTGLPQGTGATLEAEAAGYENTKARRVAMQPEPDVRVDIPLTAQVASGGEATAPAPMRQSPAAPSQQQLAPGEAHLPVYVPKRMDAAKRVAIRQ